MSAGNWHVHANTDSPIAEDTPLLIPDDRFANTDSPIAEDTPLLIPDDRALDNMSQYEHLVFYQR